MEIELNNSGDENQPMQTQQQIQNTYPNNNRISIKKLLKYGIPLSVITIMIAYLSVSGDVSMENNNSLEPRNPNLPDDNANTTIPYYAGENYTSFEEVASESALEIENLRKKINNVNSAYCDLVASNKKSDEWFDIGGYLCDDLIAAGVTENDAYSIAARFKTFVLSSITLTEDGKAFYKYPDHGKKMQQCQLGDMTMNQKEFSDALQMGNVQDLSINGVLEASRKKHFSKGGQEYVSFHITKDDLAKISAQFQGNEKMQNLLTAVSDCISQARRNMAQYNTDITQIVNKKIVQQYLVNPYQQKEDTRFTKNNKALQRMNNNNGPSKGR